MDFAAFIETLFVILAGQYIHVLIKMRNARKLFGAKYQTKIFFAENKLNLIINGSLILIFTFMLTRAGFQSTMTTVATSINPFDLFGISIPGALWLNLVIYSSYLTAGYFIQSLFYWLMKGARKKAKIETVEEES